MPTGISNKIVKYSVVECYQFGTKTYYTRRININLLLLRYIVRRQGRLVYR